MTKELDALQQAVVDVQAGQAAIIAAVNAEAQKIVDLTAQLAAAANDPAAIQALADQLETSAKALTDAAAAATSTGA